MITLDFFMIVAVIIFVLLSGKFVVAYSFINNLQSMSIDQPKVYTWAIALSYIIAWWIG